MLQTSNVECGLFEIIKFLSDFEYKQFEQEEHLGI